MEKTHNSIETGLRARLRHHTADMHLHIETLWSGSDGFAHRGAYVDFLDQALCVHRQMGLAAARLWGDADDRAIERTRIDCLMADLRMGGLPATEPEPMTDGYAWGVGYVLNGSSLGASVMLKRGDIPADWPTCYMAHGGEFVRSGRLKRFFDRLNAASIDADDAAQGALDCFAAFARQSEPTEALSSSVRLEGETA